MSQPQIALGTAQMGMFEGCLFDMPTAVQEAIDIARQHGVTHLDTSRAYPTANPGSSEELLGQADLQGLTIHTKVISNPGDHTTDGIRKSVGESLARLGVTKVHTMLLHAPDPQSDFAVVCKVMHELHQQDKFEYWGLSNFTVERVHEFIQICEANAYTKPTTYQGLYNFVARDMEDKLLPTLRKYGMAFEAYSPAAGGALNQSSSRMVNSGPTGLMARMQYGDLAEQIDKLRRAAAEQGMTPHEAALRWILHHSALDGAKGDGVVVAASNPKQLEQTLTFLNRGPLPDELVRLIEATWEVVQPSAPPYTLIGSETHRKFMKSVAEMRKSQEA